MVECYALSVMPVCCALLPLGGPIQYYIYLPLLPASLLEKHSMSLYNEDSCPVAPCLNLLKPLQYTKGAMVIVLLPENYSSFHGREIAAHATWAQVQQHQFS